MLTSYRISFELLGAIASPFPQSKSKRSRLKAINMKILTVCFVRSSTLIMCLPRRALCSGLRERGVGGESDLRDSASAIGMRAEIGFSGVNNVPLPRRDVNSRITDLYGPERMQSFRGIIDGLTRLFNQLLQKVKIQLAFGIFLIGEGRSLSEAHKVLISGLNTI